MVATGGTDHGVEVGEALNFGRVLGELLIEGIRDVVGWVSGDEQNILPHP